jgi:competence ComEA-like helix-hairpin-helix protein
MNRFFEFSPSQLKVVIALGMIFLATIVYRVIHSFAETERDGVHLTIKLGDGDSRYSPVFKVDLNRSPVDSLELIPGVGPILAHRIVAYRDSVGKFAAPIDITRVHGIGPALYEKIKTYITVAPW